MSDNAGVLGRTLAVFLRGWVGWMTFGVAWRAGGWGLHGLCKGLAGLGEIPDEDVFAERGGDDEAVLFVAVHHGADLIAGALVAICQGTAGDAALQEVEQDVVGVEWFWHGS